MPVRMRMDMAISSSAGSCPDAQAKPRRLTGPKSLPRAAPAILQPLGSGAARFGYRRRMHRPHLHGPRTLALIAAFKYLKSALLVALALSLFHLRHPDVVAQLADWLRALPVATGHQFVTLAIHEVLG